MMKTARTCRSGDGCSHRHLFEVGGGGRKTICLRQHICEVIPDDLGHRGLLHAGQPQSIAYAMTMQRQASATAEWHGQFQQVEEAGRDAYLKASQELIERSRVRAALDHHDA